MGQLQLRLRLQLQLRLVRGAKMIVLKAQFVPNADDYTDPLLVVEKIEDGYRLSRRNKGIGPSLEITASDIDPWGRNLYFWSVYGDGFVKATDYENSRDYDAFMRVRYGCPEGPIIVAARGGSNELAIVSTVPTHTGQPYLTHGYGPSIDAVELAIPGYKATPRARANKAKRELLEQVNPINMLAEQEKQIDLLSLLVLELAEKQPESEQPGWLPAFREMVEQHASTQFKGAASALNDVAARKAQMREIQRAYFDKRGF